MLVGLLLVFSATLMKLVVTNQQSARFHDVFYQLREFAESGLDLAVHEIRTGANGGDGKLGTDLWNSEVDDLGADGVAGTEDWGEKDLIPTLGENGILPLPIGPNFLGAQFFTYAEDPVDGIRRVVATAFIPDESPLTLSMYVRAEPFSIPRVGAMIVSPDVVLDFKGNAFTVNGNDTNPDGSRGSETAVYGIATLGGDPPGKNAELIESQISSKEKSHVVGLGKSPSVAEDENANLEAVLKKLLELVDTQVEAGTQTGFVLGSENDYRVGLCPGDLHLSGSGGGFGALIIEGDLVISGSFTFSGVVLVKGNVRLTGGGDEIHVLGGLIVGSGFTTDLKNTSVDMSGTADVKYSSQILDNLEATVSRKSCTVLYWEGRI